MKVIVLVLLCFQPLTCGEGLNVKEVAELAYDVITLSIDFIDKLNSNDDLEKVQESIKNLQNSVEELHDKLDYTTQLVEKLVNLINEQPYKISLSQHIEKIKSCKTDLENVIQQPSSPAARENFRKCDKIIDNVRAIGGYLSGQTILGLNSFFELYRQKEGHYRGLAIKAMFQYLYTHFIDGCTVVVTVERITFNESSKLYKDECWKMVADINSYMKSFYRKCISQSCSLFLSEATGLLKNPEIVNASSANNVLQDNFPWFQFFVLQTTTSNSTVKNNGTFLVNSKTFALHKTYRVFWTDSFVTLDQNRSDENQQDIQIPISICDYEGSSYGMNLSKLLYLDEKLFSFVAFTSNNTMDACQYSQGSHGASSTSLPPKLTMVSMFFYLAFISLFLV